MSTILPSMEDIRSFHLALSPTSESFNQIWTHSNIVWEVAKQLITKNNLPVDEKLIQVGALLHDVGIYQLIDINNNLQADKYIQHGILGEKLLQQAGFAVEICRFASHHTGVGLTKEQIVANNLPLPQQNYLAENLAEELIMYADKFHSKSVPPHFNSVVSCETKVQKFGVGAYERWQKLWAKFGEPNLLALSHKWQQKII